MKKICKIICVVLLCSAFLAGCKDEAQYSSALNSVPADSPTFDSDGVEIILPKYERDQIESMLSYYKIAAGSFDTNEDVPASVLFSPLYGSITQDTMPKDEAEKIMSEFWGREIKDVQEERWAQPGVYAGIPLDFVDDQYAIAPHGPMDSHQTAISHIYDLKNGYYKVTGITRYYGYDETENDVALLSTKDMTVIFRANSGSRFGFSIIGQKYE